MSNALNTTAHNTTRRNILLALGGLGAAAALSACGVADEPSAADVATPVTPAPIAVEPLVEAAVDEAPVADDGTQPTADSPAVEAGTQPAPDSPVAEATGIRPRWRVRDPAEPHRRFT